MRKYLHEGQTIITEKQPEDEKLTIRMLGELQITSGGQPITGFISQKSRALLCYLAVTDRPQARQKLAGLLWSEVSDQDANRSLRVALANLRQLFGPYLLITRESLAFIHKPSVKLDTKAFEEQIQTGLKMNNPMIIKSAVDLYRGDFLEGLFIGGAPAFEEWSLVERERMKQLMLYGLEMLSVHHMTQGEYRQAIVYNRRVLVLDPWREEAHRRLMLSLARDGQISAALAQYQACRQILSQELGIEPSNNTKKLYERIVSMNATNPHNLPPQVGRFIGRKAELIEILERLIDPSCRVLTLVGPGGVGKTRLAIEAVRRIASERMDLFLDGIYYVSLVSVRSPDLIVPAIADALHVSFYGHDEPMVQLLNYLREKDILLLLDNFEHQPDNRSVPGKETCTSTAFFSKLTESAPGLKLLITSRVRLNLRMEWTLDVKGLSLPDSQLRSEVERSEAAQLFLQSVRRVDAHFLLTQENIPSVARICELVDGMPLGIELAADWIRVVSCQEISQEIEHGIGFLKSSKMDLPARHRSMQAVFDQSWDLLASRERTPFKKLSIFQGGFNRIAAEQVAGITLPILSSLVNKSLLQAIPAGEQLSYPRFEMHTLMQRFLIEKLEAVPQEMNSVRDQHCGYFAKFLSERADQLRGKNQSMIIAEIRTELGNIRAAWRCAVACKNVDALDKSLDSLYRFYWMQSRYQEGELLFDLAVTGLASESESSDPEVALILGRLLANQGLFNIPIGNYVKAKSLAERSLELLWRWKAREAMPLPLRTLGQVNIISGNYEEARRFYQESLEISREMVNQRDVAASLFLFARLYIIKRDFRMAQKCLNESMAIYQEIEDLWRIGHCYHELSLLNMEIGDYEAARQGYEQALDNFTQTRGRRGVGACLHHLGLIAHRQGAFAEARSRYLEAMSIFKEVGDRRAIASSLYNLGEVAEFQGDCQEARKLYLASLDLFNEIKDHLHLANSLTGLGFVNLDAGEYREAKRNFRESLDLIKGTDNKFILLKLVVGAAKLLAIRGEKVRSAEMLNFILFHPNLQQETRKFRIAPILSNLKGELEPHIYLTAEQSGKVMTIDTLMPTLLTALEE